MLISAEGLASEQEPVTGDNEGQVHAKRWRRIRP